MRRAERIKMKKILFLCVSCFILGACSSVGLKPSCDGRSLPRPSYFAAGEKLAAFKFVSSAYGGGLEGILQIKKIDDDSFDVTLFAAAGGYRLMQAVVTRQGAAFSFLVKEADGAVARAKAEQFLNLLLFPPSGYKKCKEKNGVRTVTYQDGVRYEYAGGEDYPLALFYRKTFGSARLYYGEYAPYEEGLIPHYLYYQDGAVEAELFLITLKK